MVSLSISASNPVGLCAEKGFSVNRSNSLQTILRSALLTFSAVTAPEILWYSILFFQSSTSGGLLTSCSPAIDFSAAF